MMSDTHRTILIIDDNPEDQVAYKRLLQNDMENKYAFLVADTGERALYLYRTEKVDCILLDYRLPDIDGLALLTELSTKASTSMPPIIFLTGQGSEAVAVTAIKKGAADYLVKGQLTEGALNRAVRYTIEKKQAEINLIFASEEKERYRLNLEAIFDGIPLGLISVDAEMNIIQTNKEIRKICGKDDYAKDGKKILKPSGRCTNACIDVLRHAIKTKNAVKEYRIECKHELRPDQVTVVNSLPLRNQHNLFIGGILVIRDISQIEDLEKKLQERKQYKNIIGKNQEILKIYQLIELLADVDTTVLITGESGTGKELVAEAIHYSGARAKGPMIKVNCAALSENLLESELFGHVRGAFTGADQNKIGRFQAADNGTILLDEIGEIPTPIQIKLLRFLERKEFEMVGDSKTQKANVRVLGATNTNLKKKVEQGVFREDLYYRLKVMDIHMPSLKQRTDDIPILTQHFINYFSKQFGKNIQGVSNDVLKLFFEYSWPGNIRELKNTLERACLLCTEKTISLDHLPSDLIPIYSSGRYNRTNPTKKVIDKEAILEALEKTNGNKVQAARLLNISRSNLYNKLNEFRLSTA